MWLHPSISAGIYASCVLVFWYASNGFIKRYNAAYCYWKMTPVLMLAMMTYFASPLATKHRLSITFALLLGAIGDYLIGASDDGIVTGAIVFGIAHLLYISTFYAQMRRMHIPLLAAAIGWGIIINYLCLWDKWATYAISMSILSVYSTTLAAALVISGSIVLNGPARAENLQASLPRFIGFICFFVSDSLLIMNHVGYRIPNAEFLILINYFASQFLIVYAANVASSA